MTVPARAVVLTGLTLALAYAIVLIGAYGSGHFLYDAQGQPIANDFINVWAAGRLAVEGHAADAYDWVIHKAMEVRGAGHTFDNYYGWHYPPPFLFAAFVLALLPFTTAAIVWVAVTLPVYLAALASILGWRAGLAVALGFPATLWNIVAGQNGFLTAGLMGGALALLTRHPVAAGVCIGLLSYKPHFALLFPVALAAARQWTAFIAAGVVAVVVALASWIVFGTETWAMFLASTPRMTTAVLGEGLAEFGRLQSLYGLIRSLGFGAAAAAAGQAILAIVLAGGIWTLWRSRAAYELKAAGLAAAAVLVTPYLYIYDLCVLGVAVAFLLRLSPRAVPVRECVLLAIAVLLLLAYPYLKMQVGFAAAAIVLGLLLCRVWTAHRA